MIDFASEHDRDLERKRQKRSAGRETSHPACVNPRRRKRCEKNIFTFLRTYFPDKFYNDFTDDHKAIVKEILHRAKVGGDKAIAAPRGEGKTTIAECVMIYLLLLGLLKFPVIVAATGPHASRILENIKFELEFNDLLMEDFPEVCHYIRDLEGAPQRAAKQTHGGKPTHIEWSREVAVLPTIDGSKASGGVVKTFGLDAAIRGVNYHGRRPDFVLIDDPETRESAASEYQVGTREEIIDRDIAGLAGQGQSLGRLALCTLQSRTSLSAKLTDPKQKPSWGGSRYAMLAKKPEREDLWEEYVRLVQEGGELGTDPDARKAMAFYKSNRKEMDRGHKVSNPKRYVASKLSDGTPAEISALQHCYNIIARIGWNNFATEYQNDPPEEDGPQDNGITASLVRSRLSGVSRGICPIGTTVLTAFIDVGKIGLHWSAKAWGPGAWSCVVDHGVQNVHNAEDNRVGPERAILAALHQWREDMLSAPLLTHDGEARRFDAVIIDSGNWSDVIYKFVRQVGGAPFWAGKGFGSGYGRSPFHAPKASTDKVRVGNQWALSYQKDAGLWLFEHNADHWKRFAHDRWLTPTWNDDRTFRPGGASLFGLTTDDNTRRDSERVHMAFSNHIVAEVEKDEFIKGKGLKRFWHKEKRQNHWLDCDAGNCAAADMMGISLIAQPVTRRNEPSQDSDQKSGFVRKPNRPAGSGFVRRRA